MSKANKVLIIPLLLAFAVYGQQNEENRIMFGIGGIFSVYYTTPEAIFNEITHSEFNYADGLGLKIGLLLNIPIDSSYNRLLVLSPELYYTHRSFDAVANENSTVASISENIINVPLLVKYRFLNVMPGYIPSTYLEAGSQFGFPLKTTIENDNGYSKSYTNRGKFDFDIIVGGGYGGAVGQWGGLFAGLRLGYSLWNFNRNFDSSIGIFAEILLMWYF